MAEYDPEFARGAALQKAQMENGRRLAVFKSVLDIAAIALNAALFVNGGASVAMLAFIGAAKANAASGFDVHLLIGALTSFSLAVLAALVATGVAYLTQVKYERDARMEFDAGYERKDEPDISIEHKAVTLLIAISYLLFLVGIVVAACGMKP